MYHLTFSIVWTLATAILVGAAYYQGSFDGEPTWFKTIIMGMPLVGFLFIWDSRRKIRRYRSVREENGTFVWTELNGTERRSDTDPRFAWDKEDRDFSDH